MYTDDGNYPTYRTVRARDEAETRCEWRTQSVYRSRRPVPRTLLTNADRREIERRMAKSPSAAGSGSGG